MTKLSRFWNEWLTWYIWTIWVMTLIIIPFIIYEEARQRIEYDSSITKIYRIIYTDKIPYLTDTTWLAKYDPNWLYQIYSLKLIYSFSIRFYSLACFRTTQNWHVFTQNLKLPHLDRAWKNSHKVSWFLLRVEQVEYKGLDVKYIANVCNELYILIFLTLQLPHYWQGRYYIHLSRHWQE